MTKELEFRVEGLGLRGLGLRGLEFMFAVRFSRLTGLPVMMHYQEKTKGSESEHP